MFFRSAATQPEKKAKATVITNPTDNIFLTPLIESSAKAIAEELPRANTALFDLMSFYFTEAARTVKIIGVDSRVRKHSFKHTEEAATCKQILTDKKGPEAIADVITYLNSVHATIYSAGSFAQLLSTFFAAYPEYLPLCNQELRELLTPMDLWESSITNLITTLTTNPAKSHLADKPELLELISEVIPENLMDKYADFLLAQLRKKTADEDTPGLQKGWIYSALGMLLPRLTNMVKASAIKSALRQAVADPNNDFSLIGLGEALCNIKTEPDQLNQIASRLYLFTMKQFRSITSMHEAHRSNSIKLYAKKTFSTLKSLREQSKAQITDEMCKSLMTLMLAPECAHLLRDGILTLEDWASPESKLKFMNELNENKDFLRLAPQFWHWLEKNDKNHRSIWGLRNIYNQHLASAQNDLKGIQTLDTQATDQVKYLVADDSTKEKTRAEIIDILVEELTDHNRDLDANNIRKELHRALVAILPWADRDQRPALAKILQSGCRPKKYEVDDVRVSSGAAAAEYALYLSAADKQALSHDLVSLLIGKQAEQLNEIQAEQAAAAILVLADHLTDDALKPLMTSLMCINNTAAQMLLLQLHQILRELTPAAEAAPAPRPGQ